jgi:DNA-binding HxlR family transcriptional regulator
MPAFTFEGQTYQNPVELALHVVGGKWKMPILWRLNRRVWRYNELRRELPGISHKMLTQQLREMEQHGMIARTVYAVVPPRVEYDLTDLGRTVVPIIEQLRAWGSIYRRRRSRP